MKITRSKTILTLFLILCMSILTITACGSDSSGGGGSSPEEAVPMNPFTGQTVDEGFDENALNQRTVAFVVENSPDARPQWGMDDPQYSPDIVLQGEVEGGITRTLWLYADYNKLPEIIGPMRSARPPYIRFSKLFDAVFIHWGMSFTKGNYTGANTVFKKEKVDHINQMTFADNTGLFDRDHTRAVSMEHTGILYGAKVPDALKEAGFRTEPKEFTKLHFSTLPLLTSFTPAPEVKVTCSTRASFDTIYWTYNEEDQLYHCSSFKNDFTRDNLLVLFDETDYIDKSNYHGTGATVTYCNYKLGGGKGQLFTKGTVRDIEWKVEDGKLVLIDSGLTKTAQDKAAAAAEESGDKADEEAEPIIVNASLTPGKTWIGWVSSNNGGSVEIKGTTSE